MEVMKQSGLVVAAIFVITACSSIKVTTDFDKTADFSNYNSASFLGWQDDSDKLLNDLDKQRIRTAFKNELENRGIELVKDGGDMAISLFLVVDHKTSTTAYTNYYGGAGYGYRRAGWGWGGGHATTTYSESDYLQGTLVVDVFDASQKELVWQGVGTATVQEKPQKREKSIPKAVNAIMKSFPIAPIDK